MKKYKVMQQICGPNALGGVSKAYQRMISSDKMLEFELMPLIQKAECRGISLRLIRYYIREIRTYEPDLIEIRGVMIDGFNAVIAAKIAGIGKTVMSVHGLYSDFVQAKRYRKMIAQYIMEPLSLHMVDAVYTVYKGGLSRKKIAKWPKWLWGYIYNTMPKWEEADDAETKASCRTKLNLSKEQRVLVSITRIEYDKGFSFLKEAIEQLSADWPDGLRIVVVGQGSYKQRFMKDLKEVIECGRVLICDATDNVRPYYEIADGFITASLHENHSLSLLEACAAHIPSIATSVGGNVEIISDNESGWLIPSQNADAITCAVRNFCELEKETLCCMGETAYRSAMEKFSADIVYPKLAQCYRDVIEGRR